MNRGPFFLPVGKPTVRMPQFLQPLLLPVPRRPASAWPCRGPLAIFWAAGKGRLGLRKTAQLEEGHALHQSAIPGGSSTPLSRAVAAAATDDFPLAEVGVGLGDAGVQFAVVRKLGRLAQAGDGLRRAPGPGSRPGTAGASCWPCSRLVPLSQARPAAARPPGRDLGLQQELARSTSSAPVVR